MIGVDIRGAENAAVGNGEVTAGQVIYGQLAVTAFHRQLFDILFDVRHAQQVNVTQKPGLPGRAEWTLPC